ncbi:MAG TPA: HD domain-containing protein [Promineifilum sp.]|nr:HD domain-containing protein [Promineifilum sp.]
MSLAYRLRQLRENLTAGPLTSEARGSVVAHLSEPEQVLFSRFTFADQWHSYRVFRTLLDAGYNHPDLLVAALLHDIGKILSPLSPVDRTIIVVGGALFPRRAERWGQGSADGWRRPFVARACHPVWGAELASEAGSRSEVVDLIRRHQTRLDGISNESDRLLSRLQWADDRN